MYSYCSDRSVYLSSLIYHGPYHLNCSRVNSRILVNVMAMVIWQWPNTWELLLSYIILVAMVKCVWKAFEESFDVITGEALEDYGENRSVIQRLREACRRSWTGLTVSLVLRIIFYWGTWCRTLWKIFVNNILLMKFVLLSVICFVSCI